jgi:hypothetical protein
MSAMTRAPVMARRARARRGEGFDAAAAGNDRDAMGARARVDGRRRRAERAAIRARGRS